MILAWAAILIYIIINYYYDVYILQTIIWEIPELNLIIKEILLKIVWHRGTEEWEFESCLCGCHMREKQKHTFFLPTHIIIFSAYRYFNTVYDYVLDLPHTVFFVDDGGPTWDYGSIGNSNSHFRDGKLM